MTIDQFTKEEFEKALPRHKDTGNALWDYIGFVDGEYVYTLPVDHGDDRHVRIVIRSSVRVDDIAADSGEDSIRVWLEGGIRLSEFVAWYSLGKAGGRWITRVSGWQDRLTAKLRELYRLGMQLERCEACEAWKVVRIVKKDTPNKGRYFTICNNCDKHGRDSQFCWLSIESKVRMSESVRSR